MIEIRLYRAAKTNYFLPRAETSLHKHLRQCIFISLYRYGPTDPKSHLCIDIYIFFLDFIIRSFICTVITQKNNVLAKGNPCYWYITLGKLLNFIESIFFLCDMEIRNKYFLRSSGLGEWDGGKRGGRRQGGGKENWCWNAKWN